MNISKLIYGTTELKTQITVLKANFIGSLLIVSGVILENIIGV